MAWDRSSLRWAVALLVAAAIVVLGLTWRSRPAEQAIAPEVLRTGSPAANAAPNTAASPAANTAPSSASSGELGSSQGAGAASPAPSASVVVDVVGPVRRPGLVVLPVGSRVADAIAAAGGLARGTSRLNLARVLIDGEQINAGAPADARGPSGPMSSGASAGSPSQGTKININTATLVQLQELPRIGPVTAQKIIDFRTEHGGFRTVEQLQEVSGIGDVTFRGLSGLVVT